VPLTARREGKRSRVRAAGVGLGALALAIAAIVAVSTGGDGDAPQGPNIVIVITDDQTAAGFNRRTMPFAYRALGKRGTAFTDVVVTSPLCCPARAGFLTGQYTHNHGAWSSYPQLERPRDHLAAWLRADGYRTAMVGKYLNSYDDVVSPATEPAPGWDEWRMLMEPLSYYGYDVSVNGRRKRLGSRDRDYQTTYLNRQVIDLVERWAQGPRPFFIWYAPHAPHDEKVDSRGACAGRSVPAPGDLGRFAQIDLPRPPSFDESDVADKPQFMRRLPRLSRAEVAELEHLYRCRHASLREVDRGVEGLVEALRDSGELERTIIVLTSDNGLFYGEHRLRDGKRLPYAEAVNVPLVAWIPPETAGGVAVSRVREPVANIDLAPTLLELAGAAPCREADRCRVMDGRSLAGLIRGDAEGWPADRGRLVEMRNCRYSALLAADQLVVQHFTVPPRPAQPGGCKRKQVWERYALDDDPFQLRNAAAGRADVSGELRERLRKLRKCAGIEGRDPAPPAGRSYCE